MGKKRKKVGKSTQYSLGQLIKDAELACNISDPELKDTMMQQVNMRVRGWKLGLLRKGTWKEYSLHIANWANDKCKGLKEGDKRPEVVKFLLDSLWYEKGVTYEHYEAKNMGKVSSD